MPRPLGIVAVMLATGIVGCGGGRHPEATNAAPPVAIQVRDALKGALRQPAAPLAYQHARLPYREVQRCSGPSTDGAGRYRCHTTPRGPHGLRELVVDVRADGTWSTPPVPVSSIFRGHRRPAVSSIWGTGIRMPR